MKVSGFPCCFGPYWLSLYEQNTWWIYLLCFAGHSKSQVWNTRVSKRWNFSLFWVNQAGIYPEVLRSVKHITLWEQRGIIQDEESLSTSVIIYVRHWFTCSDKKETVLSDVVYNSNPAYFASFSQVGSCVTSGSQKESSFLLAFVSTIWNPYAVTTCADAANDRDLDIYSLIGIRFGIKTVLYFC